MKTLVIGSKNFGPSNNPELVARSIGAELYYLEDLLFQIRPGAVQLLHHGKDVVAQGYDYVMIFNCYYSQARSILYMDVGYSIALILQRAGVHFNNTELAHSRCVSKLSQMVLLGQNGIEIPETKFALAPESVLSQLTEGTPYIVKDPLESRGRANYLLNMKTEIAARLDTGAFLVQEFIENDHDLRVICFDAEPALLLKRSRTSQDTHLNNTSVGGIGEWLETIPEELAKLTRRIARLTKCEMAGIDFIETPTADGGTKYYCLEVNSIPQLTSGTDVDYKMATLKAVVGR